MSDNIVRLLVEHLPERNFIQAIYIEEVSRGAILLDSGLGAESTLVFAQSSLINSPSLPVALVLNSESKDPQDLEYKRGRVERTLGSVKRDGWVLALAIPRIDAWVKADDQIRRELTPASDGISNYRNEAIMILEIIKTRRIDRQILRKKFPDFRKLDDFVKRYTAAKPARITP